MFGPVADLGDVERQADALHQVIDKDLGFGPAIGTGLQRRPADGVSARRITAVGPVERPCAVVDVEVDRLGRYWRYLPVKLSRCYPEASQRSPSMRAYGAYPSGTRRRRRLPWRTTRIGSCRTSTHSPRYAGRNSAPGCVTCPDDWVPAKGRPAPRFEC